MASPSAGSETQCAAKELSGERAVSEAELERTLGTLRYLKGLQAARARAMAAQGPAPATTELADQCAHAAHIYACGIFCCMRHVSLGVHIFLAVAYLAGFEIHCCIEHSHALS